MSGQQATEETTVERGRGRTAEQTTAKRSRSRSKLRRPKNAGSKLKGMVKPDRKMLTYYVDFTRVIDRKLKLGVANGRVLADGEEIYQVKDMKVGLATDG